MNISAIQTFLAVHRLRNLNRAAEELNITQSAVTARLDTLEASLGAPLLNRSRKGATLTKAGYAFLDQAHVITRTWEAARAKAAFPTGVTRLFSIVVEPGMWQGLCRKQVDEWRQEHPETAFEIWTALARDASEWLTSGMSDAAVMPDPVHALNIRHRVLAEDTLVQVSTRARSAVAWDAEYVFVDYGQAFRNWHTQTWPGDETARMSFSSPDWALHHLLARGGSAYLHERIVKDRIKSGRLHLVDGAASFTRQAVLSWRKEAEAQFGWLPDTA